MPSSDLPPEHAEPPEEALRQLLDVREHEKEAARKQLSRKFTKILLVAAVVLIGVILCFPNNRKMIDAATHENPQMAELKAAILSRQNPEAAKIPDELKPFTVRPEQHADHENLRFGMELLNFLQPPAAGPSKKQP